MPHWRQIFLLVLTFCVAGCSKRAEVGFYLCHRRVPADVHSAESSVPDLNTYLNVFQSDTIWKEAAPLIGARITDAQKFRASIAFKRIAQDSSTPEAHRLGIIVSASGPSQDDVTFALGVLIDGLGRWVAPRQPQLRGWKSTSFEDVAYDKITGSKEKLYRYIER